MKVCILGDGLTSLTLAQAIVNLGINVDVVYQKKLKNTISHEHWEFQKIM